MLFEYEINVIITLTSCIFSTNSFATVLYLNNIYNNN
jgi:hypothetical protein